MANRRRGEIEAEIGGAKRCLVLTLGALAELEDAFKAVDLRASRWMSLQVLKALKPRENRPLVVQPIFTGV